MLRSVNRDSGRGSGEAGRTQAERCQLGQRVGRSGQWCVHRAKHEGERQVV